MLQPISIDSSDFPELRGKRCIYVDKTSYLHSLICGPNARFFIARPRRFGKSLMISTLKAIFAGRRELFDGLAISKTDWKWEKFPVLYLNLGFVASSRADDFETAFPAYIKNVMHELGVEYDTQLPVYMNFGMAIDSLHASSGGKGVVMLFDESADAALTQVKTKGHDAPYHAKAIPIWLAGLSFDRETRQLVWCVVNPLRVPQAFCMKSSVDATAHSDYAMKHPRRSYAKRRGNVMDLRHTTLVDAKAEKLPL